MRRLSVRRAPAVALLLALSGTMAPLPAAWAGESAVESAAQLIEQGRAVEAKSVLLGLRRSASNEADQARILELLGAAERRLRLMDQTELSLQKAELAVKQGELRVAEAHAKAAERSDRATPEQAERARTVQAEAQNLRESLAPMVGSVLAQAVSDFDGGRYADAKAGLASVVRTGVALDQNQQATLNRHQERIYQLEREQGTVFEVDYVPLSVMQSAAASAGAARAMAAASVSAEPEPAAEAPERADVWQLAQADTNQGGDALLDDAAKFDAERLMNEAEAAYAAGRFNEAADKFTLVTTTYSRFMSAEQLDRARGRLGEARAQLGQGGTGSIDTVVNQVRVMREQAIAEFENQLSQARRALERGDVQSARNAAAQARLGWNGAYAGGLFAEDQFRARSTEVDQLLRDIDASAERLTITEIERREQQLRDEEARTRDQQATERQARINENLSRLRALQAEQKYEEALQVADQVLFLDPTNPAALLLKDVLKDVILYREFEQVRRQRTLSYTTESVEIDRATIVPDSIIAFPPDWPEISIKRGEVQSFVESELDRRVLATLETRRIPASFRDNSLEDVLSFIATVTNLNLDVDWDSLEQIGVERDKQISLELREVPARVVLERVLEKAQPDAFSRAGWAVNDGVLVVAADEALRKNTFIVIYDIRDLLFQIPNFDNAPALDLDQVLNQGQQGGGGGGGGIFEDEGEGGGQGLTEQELMRRILEIIQTNVDLAGWRDNGGDTGVIQEINGNLIITNTARNHREIQGLLNQLREIRSVQINVESRFLTVAQDFFEQIGFDLDVYFNAQNEQFDAVQRQLSAFGQGALADEGLSVVPSDIVTGRNGNNRGYTFTGLDADGNPTFAFQDQPYSIPAPDSLSVIPAQSNSASLTESLITGFGRSILDAGNPALAVAGTFLDDVQVDFLIEATQADRRNVSLSAPRLTFSNGRSANISVVNQVGFISDLTPVAGTSSVTFDPTVGRINSGFTLAVRGVASADRRYVTLTVQAAVSGRPSFRAQQVTGAAGGQGDNAGGNTATANIEIPTLDVTQVNTGVTVPDRGTVLLGGQRLTTELEVETGVPVLSKIPIINRFFTNRAESKEERTLLILLKPTILIQNEEENDAFPGLLDKLQNPYR